MTLQEEKAESDGEFGAGLNMEYSIQNKNLKLYGGYFKTLMFIEVNP
jgi:hypothetical protein